MPIYPDGRVRRPTIVMHAFFDESSGKGSKGFVCMTGFISDEARWNAFTSDWVALLDRHGLRDVGLHTKDFMAAKIAPYDRFESIGWHGRAELLRQFISIVRRDVLFGISIGVDSEPFKRLCKPFRARIRGADDPYQFCFVRILKRLVLAAEQRGFNRHIALMVDDNEQQSMAYYQHYRRIGQNHPDLRRRICYIAFGDDRVNLPLQAADMLAWITSQEMRKENPDWENSPFSEILLTPDPAVGIRYEQEYWNEEEINTRLAKTYAEKLG